MRFKEKINNEGPWDSLMRKFGNGGGSIFIF